MSGQCLMKYRSVGRVYFKSSTNHKGAQKGRTVYF